MDHETIHESEGLREGGEISVEAGIFSGLKAQKGGGMSRRDGIIFRKLSDRWLQNSGENCDEFKVSGGLDLSIRRFMVSLPAERILLAMDVAFANVQSGFERDRHKYFCAICWRMIRGQFTDSAYPAVKGPLLRHISPRQMMSGAR